MNTTLTVVRRPDGGRKGRNGAEVKIAGPVNVSVPSDEPTIHEAFPPSGGYSFAFWWVQGSATGNFVSLANPISISPGPTDIVVKCWFTRTTPAPPSGTALFVDAFDLDKGSFLDDDFVVVKDADQQPNTQLTQDANNNAIVATQSTQLVEATNIGFRPLDRWECVRGQETIAGGQVTAAQASNAEAIAFYKASSLPGFLFAHKTFEAQTWVSWGVTVDGGGPTGGGPVPPWDPLMRDVAAGLAVAQAAAKLRPSLRAQALRLAAKQISTASEEIADALEAAAKAAAKSER